MVYSTGKFMKEAVVEREVKTYFTDRFPQQVDKRLGLETPISFSQTDAIAHKLARQAAFRRSRPAPNYLPTQDQKKLWQN